MTRHQWRAVVVYVLDEEDAAKFYAGPPGPPVVYDGTPDPSRLILTAEMVDQKMSAVACFVCEKVWLEGRHSSCPGEPIGYGANGEPIYKLRRR